jgi:GT2 family glycosyltransferase
MNKPQPRVAVIVVSWNNLDILPDCLNSVREQTYPAIDTFLIDNASKDDTVTVVGSAYPEVKLLPMDQNLGFSKGNNVAIKHAMTASEHYDYFVFLNSDARLRADWVERMVAFAESKPTGALFQSTTLDYYNRAIIDSTHIYISVAGQGTQGNWREPYTGEHGPFRAFGVNAAAALISRRFVEAQPFDDLFDEKMFMYLEDVDLSTRATVMGWDNYLVDGTEAYHMGSASSGKNPGFSLYMTFRNNSALLIKNLPPSICWKIAPAVARADYHTVKHLIKLGKYAAARKVVSGRLVGLLRLPLYLGDVRIMARHRVIDRDYLYHLMRTGRF